MIYEGRPVSPGGSTGSGGTPSLSRESSQHGMVQWELEPPMAPPLEGGVGEIEPHDTSGGDVVGYGDTSGEGQVLEGQMIEGQEGRGEGM